jgi:uridine kinase
MSQLIAKTHFSDQNEARAYILSCEDAFAEQMKSAAARILAEPSCKLLGLGGPSCAGKSTTAKLLIRHLEAAGKHVHMISIDDFFREQHETRLKDIKNDPDQKIDFDSIDALDFPLFCQCVEQLMKTGKTEIPQYDLSCGKRKGTQEYRIKDENDLFLFEGIQTVYPEISGLLEQYPYYSMYINVSRELRAGDRVFEPNQIRLLRRLVRDYYRRASTPDFTLFLWNSVRDNEEKNIFPYVDHCREQFDSTMGYEIGMLRPYLEIILPSILDSNDYGHIAKVILEDIKFVPPLSCDLLPQTALYHEFVGRVR